MKIRDLIALQRRCHGARRIRSNLGDGYLYLQNRFYRQIRDAAVERGFRFTTSDPTSYFGFPLASLEAVLATRRIPHRDNFAALVALERGRPHFFTLRDLEANRPTPNYLLHEAAHGVAYHELFGRPRSVRDALSDPDNLVRVMSGEAFAMTAEYLAACSVAGATHRWLFGINSYRHRVQMKKPLGELAEHFGLELVATALFVGFLYTNFLRAGIRTRNLREGIERFSVAATHLGEASDLERLRRAVVGATRMNPEFLEDTTRLFLTRLGYSRNLRRVLGDDPLRATVTDDQYDRAVRSMLTLLTG